MIAYQAKTLPYDLEYVTIHISFTKQTICQIKTMFRKYTGFTILMTHLKRTPLITCQALGCCCCCCWGSCSVAPVWATWPEAAAPLLLTCTEHSVIITIYEHLEHIAIKVKDKNMEQIFYHCALKNRFCFTSLQTFWLYNWLMTQQRKEGQILQLYLYFIHEYNYFP